MKIELTHDLIARKVRDAVSAQDRARLHAQHIIRVRHELYLTTPQLLLSADELSFIQPHKSVLLLSESEQEFLASSERAAAIRLRWVLLRNFFNIAFVVGALFALWGLREYRRAERGADQNKELATDLLEISADIRRIKSLDDFNNLQKRITELRRTKLTDAQVSEWLRTANTDSLLETLREPYVIGESFAAALRPLPISGKIHFPKTKHKGPRRAIIDVLGMKVPTDPDGNFTIYVLTDPALLPPHFNISVEADGFKRYSDPISPIKSTNNSVSFPTQDIHLEPL